MCGTIAASLMLANVLFVGGAAYAYGGGGSGHGCAEPQFFEAAPTGTVAQLAGFGFIASANTDIDSLTVELNGQKLQPSIVQRRNGDFEIRTVPPQPLTQPGKARIAINARSKEGCWGFQPYFLDIKP